MSARLPFPPLEKLDPKVKRRWLKALRSGEYEQGRYALLASDEDGSNPTYCCLGVLVNEEYDGDWVCKGVDNFDISSPRDFDDLRDRSAWAIDGFSEKPFPPPLFMAEIGFRPGYERMLAKMNDLDGLSFGEIADWIERHM